MRLLLILMSWVVGFSTQAQVFYKITSVAGGTCCTKPVSVSDYQFTKADSCNLDMVFGADMVITIDSKGINHKYAVLGQEEFSSALQSFKALNLLTNTFVKITFDHRNLDNALMIIEFPENYAFSYQIVVL